MTQAKLSVHRLEKSFGPKHVLKGVDFEVFKGESLVIIGGSGTGKSVTLKCLLGLMTPDKGEIHMDGIPLHKGSSKDWEKARHKIGMLFQGAALFDSLKVWENIYFSALQSKTMTREEAQSKAPDLLNAVGLKKEVTFLYPAELSGGMQRRVGLARAIALQPEILFFDEPTAGLDPIISGVINQLILKNVKELGATAITITHDMRSARTIADRIAMIHEGRILWQGSVHEIDTCDNPYVQQFIHGSVTGPISV
jgi:phospholipid/cholesterol/gamma-HCH transport system ATP-binding protein